MCIVTPGSSAGKDLVSGLVVQGMHRTVKGKTMYHHTKYTNHPWMCREIFIAPVFTISIPTASGPGPKYQDLRSLTSSGKNRPLPSPCLALPKVQF